MRGTVRKISLSRRFVTDLMRASADVPFVAVRRTLAIGRLAAARKSLRNRPAWAAIFAKAFAILASEKPVLRRLYPKWPWPHFYEFPQTLAMIVVAPDATPDGVLMFPVKAPDLTSLAETDAMIRRAKSRPIEAIPFFRKTMMVTRLPQPLRRPRLGDRPQFRPPARQLFRHASRDLGCGLRRRRTPGAQPWSFILSYDRCPTMTPST